ncbi:MAG: hypothetical protein NTZ44_01620 [Candidatus Nomurabacteria bacterium]|nr:hypothetical protein [Candidatus Nomurabacteria bacterium]
MKKIILTLGTVIMIIGATFADDVHKNTEQKGKVIIIYNLPLPDSTKDAMQEIITKYNKSFPLNDTLRIDSMPLLYEGQNFQEVGPVFGKPGGLLIDNEQLQKLNSREVKSFIAGQLFQTLSPVEIDTIFTNFELDSGMTAIGFSGLATQIHISNFISFLTPMETGAAEAFARKVCKGFYVERDLDSSYFRLGHLMTFILGNGWLTAKDLIDAEKTNNVPRIVSLILKKEVEKIDTDDIYLIIKLFDDICFSKKEESLQDLQYVFEERKKNGDNTPYTIKLKK